MGNVHLENTTIQNNGDSTGKNHALKRSSDFTISKVLRGNLPDESLEEKEQFIRMKELADAQREGERKKSRV